MIPAPAMPEQRHFLWQFGQRVTIMGTSYFAGTQMLQPPPFAPVETIAGRRDAGLLLLCDHASATLPPEYGDLGLPPQAFQRHIAYDIGAAHITRHLAGLLAAPAVLATFSRLLIDPNRGEDDPTLVMKLSDGAIIPGNADTPPEEIARRLEMCWRPYRLAVRAEIDAMLRTSTVPAIVSVHSMTHAWKGALRPWQVSVLWDKDPRLAVPFMARLRAQPDLLVGDNQPYDGALEGDTMDENATRRGLPHLLIEVRQDLIGTRAAAQSWAERLAAPLREVLALPGVQEVRHYGSRTRPEGALRSG